MGQCFSTFFTITYGIEKYKWYNPCTFLNPIVKNREKQNRKAPFSLFFIF